MEGSECENLCGSGSESHTDSVLSADTYLELLGELTSTTVDPYLLKTFKLDLKNVMLRCLVVGHACLLYFSQICGKSFPVQLLLNDKGIILITGKWSTSVIQITL